MLAGSGNAQERKHLITLFLPFLMLNIKTKIKNNGSFFKEPLFF